MFTRLVTVSTTGSFGETLAYNSEEPIKCVSLNNQQCQARPTIININYPFTLSVNNWGWSCNTIHDPYAGVYVLDKVKNMNEEVFNLMLGENEARFLVQPQLRGSKRGLNESACNSNQKCNYDKCRCECK